MKKHLNNSATLSFIFFIAMLFSSFSVNYSRYDRHEEKLSRRQERLEKQKEKIIQKINQAKNERQKLALEKKLQNIKKRQEEGTPALAVLGMVFSIIGFLILLVGIIAALSGGGLGGIAIVAGVISLIGLIFSIAGVVMNNKAPDEFTGRGFAVAGLVIGLITFLASVIIFFATFSFGW